MKTEVAQVLNSRQYKKMSSYVKKEVTARRASFSRLRYWRLMHGSDKKHALGALFSFAIIKVLT